MSNDELPELPVDETLRLEVEFDCLSRTGEISSYACYGKTWADLGYPEP